MKTFFLQPLITEKSLGQAAGGVYSFVVPTWASKPQIADKVANHFDVVVTNVTTATLRGDAVRFRNKAGKRATMKKAVVTLQSGQTIADFSMPVEEQAPAAPAEGTNDAPVADKPTESKITVRTKGKKAEATGEEK